MKKYAAALLLSLSFLYLLCFPQAAVSHARDGLLLWYRSVLPVLFPFFFLSGLLLHLLHPELIPAFLIRPFHALFGCSPCGAMILMAGFLCGCPVGAKLTSQFLESGKIRSGEARHLYGFVNNLSPGFLVSGVAAAQLQNPGYAGWLLFEVFGAALLYGMLTARRDRKKTEVPSGILHSRLKTQRTASVSSAGVSEKTAGAASALSFSVVDECISDAASGVLRLCAYLMLFSILSGAAAQLLPTGSPAVLLSVAFLEVTNGVRLIQASALPLSAKYLSVTALCAFGGLSALAQSAGIARMDRETLLFYLKSRVKITLLAILLALPSLWWVLS